MQLKKLKLSGFKSFVEPTELFLEPGLTGIVGPNGCGKSNLVDALKWVMGETSAKQLRGGEMDDVIFAGTQSRPPRNFSEVVLSLDNSTRKAPSQFNHTDDLEVSRRIDRGEGSTYRVNQHDVRARDVQTLFADAATGAHSTAIVSQGKVGHIVNAKPQERRALLEEAAGIVGLHARRHEAELRLNAAENNLKRGEDLLRNLQEQLQGLKKQARQASSYRSIAGRIRETEALFYYHMWQDLAARLSDAETRRSDIESQLQELDIQATEQAGKQAGIAAEMPEARKHEAERAAILQRLKIAEGELQAEEARMVSAQIAASQRCEQIQSDLVREEELLSDAKQNSEQAASYIAALEQEIAQSGSTLDAKKSAYAALSERLAASEKELEDFSDKLNRDESHWNAEQKRLDSLLQQSQKLSFELEKIISQNAALSAALKSDGSIDILSQEVLAAEQNLQAAKESLGASEDAVSQTQAGLAAAQKTYQQALASSAKLQAELFALEKILGEETDIDDPVMDKITVQPGYEAALSAALGDDLFASLGGSEARFWQSLPAYDRPPQWPEGVEPLARFVKEAPESLSRALSLIGLVRDPETAKSLQHGLNPGEKLVTMDGRLWRFDGYVAQSGEAQKAAAHLQRKNRLPELRREFSLSQTDMQQAAGRQTDAESAHQQAQQTMQQARMRQEQAYSTLQTARQKHAETAQRIAVEQSTLNAGEQQAAKISADAMTLLQEIDALSAMLAAKPDFSALRAEMQERRKACETLRAETYESKNAFDLEQSASQARQSRLQQLQQQSQRWESRSAEAAKQRQTLQTRLEQAKAELSELQNKPQEIAAKRQELLSKISEAEQARQQAADSLAELEGKLQQADRALKALQGEIAERREERVKHQTAIELGAEEQQKLRYDMTERLEASPEQLLEIAAPKDADNLPDLQTTQNKLERLRRERDNMGPVNLRAEEEAAEIEAKSEKQQAEHNDLIEAIAKLRQGIQTLNREGRERLQEAFHKVNANFEVLFTRLFGGGQAHLTWVDHEDPLQAGLEIMASPPGKKLQSLSLLSGGERALTAIALLFAVFQCNPAPLCVLDEVDAPLDENNVDRFCTLLEQMAKETETRYVVVTHHRMTISRMHRLYGVTMGEPGVSQLVSVDLRMAENLRATA